MLNRRTFLKTGLTTGVAVIPLPSALHALDPASTFSKDGPAFATAPESTAKLIPLPKRMASLDPAAMPWQQRIRRVGQSVGS
jgi:hypothetical protein